MESRFFLTLMSALGTSLSIETSCSHYILIWGTYMILKFDIREVRWLSSRVRLKTHFPLIPPQHWGQGLSFLTTLIGFKVWFPALILESRLLFPLQKTTAKTYWQLQALWQLLALWKTFLLARPQTSYLELVKLFTSPPLSIDQVEMVITQWSSRQPARQEHQHDTFLCTGRFTTGT